MSFLKLHLCVLENWWQTPSLKIYHLLRVLTLLFLVSKKFHQLHLPTSACVGKVPHFCLFFWWVHFILKRVFWKEVFGPIRNYSIFLFWLFFQGWEASTCMWQKWFLLFSARIFLFVLSVYFSKLFWFPPFFLQIVTQAERLVIKLFRFEGR